jgi:hypothetical protein
MEPPQIRPGLVRPTEPMTKVVAFFRNSAGGNAAIQLLTALGVPADRLGVTPPEQIAGGQGMLLSVGCPEDRLVPRVEQICRSYGAEVHRRRR